MPIESAIGRPLSWAAGAPRRLDLRAIWIWLLAGGLVLFLGIDGGGYDLVVRSQAAIVVWWVVLLAAAWGLLPAGRITRAGWAGLALLAVFVAWSALATTWSESADRSLEEVSRLAGYFGVLVLGLISFDDRRSAVRHAIGAVATAVVLIAGLAVLSRLRPGLFPAAQTTAAFLPGAHPRLGWPLNYWNALAALIAIGLPLLLSLATTARTLAAQAAAAAALPLLALCAYLTFSRGGAGASVVALLVFVALTPDRLAKLPTLLAGAAGGATLIAGAVHRHAIEQGLTTPVAAHEGRSLLVAVILVCAGVAVTQVGVGLALRHATAPRWLRISPRASRVALAVVVVAVVAVGLAAHGPAHVSHAWHQFKQPQTAALRQNAISRYGALSGNGRYTYWKTAVDSLGSHALAGYGPGTFQFVWLRHAPFFSYITNAHSLYIETLTEVGVVGLVVLVAFLALLLGAAIRLSRRRGTEWAPAQWATARDGAVPTGAGDLRVQGAAITAALAAFALSAALDWIWQVPVLPVAVLLLAAALLAPDRGAGTDPGRDTAPTAGRRRLGRWPSRIALVAVALLCLVAIGIPLAATSALRASQAAASAGALPTAASDANSAVRLAPDGASARLQLALVLEMQGDLPGAIAQATRSAADEPANWQPWFVLSRLQAESGHAAAALAAYRHARSLDPHSPLFH